MQRTNLRHHPNENKKIIKKTEKELGKKPTGNQTDELKNLRDRQGNKLTTQQVAGWPRYQPTQVVPKVRKYRHMLEWYVAC